MGQISDSYKLLTGKPGKNKIPGRPKRWWKDNITKDLDDWLTVQHRSITLVDFQLDAQNSYLFTYNTFIEILYMFRALPCSSSEGLRRNCIYAASGIVTVCRWLSCAPVKKELLSFLTGAQDSHLQRVKIPEAAYTQLRRRPPEDEQGNARNM